MHSNNGEGENMCNFLNLAEKNKRLAAIQCIKLLGNKNPESVNLEDNGYFTHVNSRGRKRTMLVCSTYKEYEKKQKLHPDAQMMKCISFYVLYW